MTATSAEIDEFFAGPLIKWLSTCIKDPPPLLTPSAATNLFDGSAIYEVLLQIDPQPTYTTTTTTTSTVSKCQQRQNLFTSIVKNIKSIYRDELGQLIVKLPDCRAICHQSNDNQLGMSRMTLENLRLLLLLLLGCAVQGPTKESFIQRIKLDLDLETQHNLVECIKLITDGAEYVIHLQEDGATSAQSPPLPPPPPQLTHTQICDLIRQRDQFYDDIDGAAATVNNNNKEQENKLTSNTNKLNFNIELADFKARMRHLQQECDEKSEQLAECQEELQHAKCQCVKLKQENAELVVESRRVKAYQDEIDVLRERAAMADRLSGEIARYRDKMADGEFFRARVDELREDNRVLTETREMLDDQLMRMRTRLERHYDLERELMTLKQALTDVTRERDVARLRILELDDEIAQYELRNKSFDLKSDTNSDVDIDLDTNNDSSLSEQLAQNESARAHKLSLENQRLLDLVDELKEENLKIRNLTLKLEHLEKVAGQNGEGAEKLRSEAKSLRHALEEEKKLTERQCQMLTTEKLTINNLERVIATLRSDNQRLMTENQESKTNLDNLAKVRDQNEITQAQNVELERKSAILEKDNLNLKEKLEQRDVTLDAKLTDLSNLTGDLERVTLDLTHAHRTISTLETKLHSLETSAECSATLPDFNKILKNQNLTLQLANTQLVGEIKELKLAQVDIDSLSTTHSRLTALHEQLTLQYEMAKADLESMKKSNRDLRTEMRTVRELNATLEVKLSNLTLEKDSLTVDTRNLSNLRAEHSKLKDDFRNLFTASERMKIDYRHLQQELKSIRSESRELRLSQTEIQGELCSSSDILTGLEVENAKLQQKCDMLFEMNHALDADRRALMDHVSQLLTQYHALLTHSLDDKHHYHLEEKFYNDKVNNLSRQKEKLEEKIMEHYRKLDNANNVKKKSFGATFVQRMLGGGNKNKNQTKNRQSRPWQHDNDVISNNDDDIEINNDTVIHNDGDDDDDDNNDSSENDSVVIRRQRRKNSSVTTQQNGDMSLGSVGSRRTVYLSEDDTCQQQPVSTSASSGTEVATSTTGVAAAPPTMLVYNRISTVIGECAKKRDENLVTSTTTTNNQEPSSSSLAQLTGVNNNNDSSKGMSTTTKESAIWYEYGCV